jgi:hypothetical protein
MSLPRRHIAVVLGLGCLMPLIGTHPLRAEEAASRPSYLALGEFTVNMPGENGGLSYAVVGVTLEAVPAAMAALRAITPRLKEAVMRRLMVMAERGALQPDRTDPVVLEAALLDSVSVVRPDSVRDVLITRLIFG